MFIMFNKIKGLNDSGKKKISLGKIVKFMSRFTTQYHWSFSYF